MIPWTWSPLPVGSSGLTQCRHGRWCGKAPASPLVLFPILRALLLAILSGGAPVGMAAANPAAPQGSPSFEKDIRPILKAHCFSCHGEGDTLKGGVDLRLRRFMLTNSESGTVVSPGDPARSVLHQVVASQAMPKAERKLTPEQVATIERWILAGAPTLRPEPEQVPRFVITEEERSFWAFQPVRRPGVPASALPAGEETPVDRFLAARFRRQGLEWAPPADRETLLRRVTFDLTGLPPTPEEVEAFLADGRDGAYERVVTRLLHSPHFGERWARHWLDIAGYADSNGGPESDSDRPWAWRYRDYVIRSLNADKPWNRFLTEQLAGDELVRPPYDALDAESLDCLVATGYLRMAPDPTGDGPPDPVLAQNQVIADTLQIVSTSLLGLTVQCAQCHDHRYDPIPQSDYYRLRAVFEPAFNWKQWKTPDARAVSISGADVRARSEAIETEARKIDQDAQKLHDELIEAFVQRQLEFVPKALHAEVLAARRTPKDQRTDRQKELLREHVRFQDGILLGEIDRDGAKRVDEVRKKATELRATKPAEERVHALVEDPGKLAETVLFRRGDPQQPADPVLPGGLSVLDALLAQEIPATNASLRTSGRRLALARQLTDRRHPLVPRVLVNRLWHHVFGAGLVPTLADFGTLGERPSHPELLDWLASEWIDCGWELKSFLRMLVTTRAYRQSAANPNAERLDPDNRLLARRALRRLDAESLRDSMLSISGRLTPAMFGRPVPVAFNAQGQVVVGAQARNGNGDPTGADSVGGDEHRRSIYVTARRTAPLGVLETFDAPPSNPNCEIRPSSTVALQSLLLLNDEFVVARSAELADRVNRECPDSMDARIARAWFLAFGRRASSRDLHRCREFLDDQTAVLTRGSAPSAAAAGPSSPERLALASLCQAFFNANAFLYVE